MFRSLSSLGSKDILPAFLACCFLSLAAPTGSLFAQDPPPQNLPPPANPPATSPDSPTKSPQETPAREGQEVSTQDTPATFKVRVNNVLVRVVVRDSHGKVVPNLKKEDFQLYDGRKLQAITSFAIENPRTHTVPLTTTPEPVGSSDADPASVKAAALPQRFVSMVFDDMHMSMQDAVFVRDSATRFTGSSVTLVIEFSARGARGRWRGPNGRRGLSIRSYERERVDERPGFRYSDVALRVSAGKSVLSQSLRSRAGPHQQL